MANPTIRGHQGRFKIYQDGRAIDINTITRVSVSMDSSFSKQFFLGNPVPEGDQTVEGWSGSLDMQVRDAVVDDFIDALITNNLAGVNISDYMFVVTELYSNGTERSYAYVDCQFKMSKDQGGLTEKQMKRLDFQAAHRVRL